MKPDEWYEWHVHLDQHGELHTHRVGDFRHHAPGTDDHTGIPAVHANQAYATIPTLLRLAIKRRQHQALAFGIVGAVIFAVLLALLIRQAGVNFVH